MRKLTLVLLALTLICLVGVVFFAAIGLLWPSIRPAPSETNQMLFQGVRYTRDVRDTPRQIIVHVLTVDLRTAGLEFLVTPGEASQELPLKARTTSQFLSEFDLQIAINGDGFTPWYSRSIFDYYPRKGDRVEPIGFAASKGKIYSQTTDAEPTLYISNNNRARFNTPAGKIYNAISGNTMLVERGKPFPGLDDQAEPRTAIGLDRRARQLIIVVIDGRQPGFSEGVSLQELADIMIEFDAYWAMNLDGGGSSTLVKQGALGRPVRLNFPINHQIPGRERVIGNHLGISAPKLASD